MHRHQCCVLQMSLNESVTQSVYEGAVRLMGNIWVRGALVPKGGPRAQTHPRPSALQPLQQRALPLCSSGQIYVGAR